MVAARHATQTANLHRRRLRCAARASTPPGATRCSHSPIDQNGPSMSAACSTSAPAESPAGIGTWPAVDTSEPVDERPPIEADAHGAQPDRPKRRRGWLRLTFAAAGVGAMVLALHGRLPSPAGIAAAVADAHGRWLLTAAVAQAVSIGMFARQQQRLLAALVGRAVAPCPRLHSAGQRPAAGGDSCLTEAHRACPSPGTWPRPVVSARPSSTARGPFAAASRTVLGLR
jgi:hypothetical protein